MADSSRFSQFKARVLATIAAIPECRVTTYGAIGRHLNGTARQVAKVLVTLTAEESKGIPWFRVVAANGVVSSMNAGPVGPRQIKRLRAEGVSVTPKNRVEDFKVIVWEPGF